MNFGINVAAAYGLLAHSILAGALVGLLPLGAYRARVALATTTTVLLVGIAPTLHGLFGAPSATLLQLAILVLAGQRPPSPGQSAGLALLAGAALFYPAALGWGPFDPYAIGYRPAPLLAVLLPLGIWLGWRRQFIWLSILAIDLLAYTAGVFTNLWDALFDPLLVVIVLLLTVRQRVPRALSQ